MVVLPLPGHPLIRTNTLHFDDNSSEILLTASDVVVSVLLLLWLLTVCCKVQRALLTEKLGTDGEAEHEHCTFGVEAQQHVETTAGISRALVSKMLGLVSTVCSLPSLHALCPAASQICS